MLRVAGWAALRVAFAFRTFVSTPCFYLVACWCSRVVRRLGAAGLARRGVSSFVEAASAVAFRQGHVAFCALGGVARCIGGRPL